MLLSRKFFFTLALLSFAGGLLIPAKVFAGEAVASDVDLKARVELQWFDLNEHTKTLEWRTAVRWMWSKNAQDAPRLPAVPVLELWIEIPRDVELKFSDYDAEEFAESAPTNAPITAAPGYKLMRVETQSPKLSAQARNAASEKESFGVRISIVTESTKLLVHNTCRERGIDISTLKASEAYLFIAAFCEGQSTPVVKLMTSMDAFFADGKSRYKEVAYSPDLSKENQALDKVSVVKKFATTVSDYQLVRKNVTTMTSTTSDVHPKSSWLWLAEMAKEAPVEAPKEGETPPTVPTPWPWRAVIELAPSFTYYQFTAPTGGEAASEANLIARAILAYRWNFDWALRLHLAAPVTGLAPEFGAEPASGIYSTTLQGIYSAYAEGKTTTLHLLFGVNALWEYMRKPDQWSQLFFGPVIGLRLGYQLSGWGGRQLMAGVDLSPLFYSDDPVVGTHLFSQLLLAMELTNPDNRHNTLRWDAIFTYAATVSDTDSHEAPDHLGAASLGLRAIF